MGKKLFITCLILLWCGISNAQVTPGSINTKTGDGIGNKITSEVVGLDRALHVYCLGGSCGSGAGTTDVNVIQLLGIAPSATNPFPQRLSTGAVFYDARDRNWTLNSGTDSVTVIGTVTANQGGAPWQVQSNSQNIATETTLGTRLADTTFTGRFTAGVLDADAIVNETSTAVRGKCYLYNGATWDRCRGSIAGGMLVNISNATLAVTQSGVWSVGRTWTLSSGTDSVSATVSNAFLLDATFTNRFPAGSTPADNESNAVTITRFGNYNFIFDGVTWDRWTGGVSQVGTWNIGTLTSITNTVTVQGTKTNNNAAPGTNNIGSLGCVATANAPTYTEGNQVGCSTNLNGAQRVIEQNFISTANNDGACPSGAANFTVAASNSSRTWLAIWASPANTDDVYVKLGVTATTSDARIAPGQSVNFTAGRIYTGQIDAIPNSGTQAVCLMELN